MRLGRALQSMRLCAGAAAGARRASTKQQSFRRARFIHSLVAQCLNGIEAGGAACGIEAGNKTHSGGEHDCERDEPPRHCPEMFGWKRLAAKIDVGSEIDELADDPSEDDSEDAA